MVIEQKIFASNFFFFLNEKPDYITDKRQKALSKNITFKAISSDTVERYRVEPSSGQLPPLTTKFALQRLESCRRTSDMSSLSSFWLSIKTFPCSSSREISATDVMHWNIASNLSNGKVPGPFISNSCSEISFCSIDFSDGLKHCKKWHKLLNWKMAVLYELEVFNKKHKSQKLEAWRSSC